MELAKQVVPRRLFLSRALELDELKAARQELKKDKSPTLMVFWWKSTS